MKFDAQFSSYLLIISGIKISVKQITSEHLFGNFNSVESEGHLF